MEHIVRDLTVSDGIIDGMMGEDSGQQADTPTFFRRLAFVIIAGFILIAPAMPQVFGITSVFFRPWTMFSGVGIGLLKGEFIETSPHGDVTRHSPQHVLGRERYSRAMTSPHPYLVLSEAHLTDVAAPFCETISRDTRLAFDGYRQTRNGWVRLTTENVCEGA